MSPDPIIDKLNDIVLGVAKVETKLDIIAANNTALVLTMTDYIRSNKTAKDAVDGNRKWLVGLTIGTTLSVISLIITIIIRLLMV